MSATVDRGEGLPTHLTKPVLYYFIYRYNTILVFWTFTNSFLQKNNFQIGIRNQKVQQTTEL